MSMTEVFYSSDYNFSQMTDEDLIELIKSDNNKHALEHLINRYSKQILYYRSRKRRYYTRRANWFI